MDKRNFTRIDFPECASLKHDGHVFFVDIQNISLKGLFVKTNQKLSLNSTLDITVYNAQQFSIHLHANVVRCEETGIAMQIENIDVDSFAHLRDIIATECNDQTRIIQETYKMTSSIH